MNDVDGFKMRDWCLIWGLPFFVFLLISLLVSLVVGANFDDDNFVRAVVFLSCLFLLSIVYYIFQSFWVELFSIAWNRRRRRKVSAPNEMPKAPLLLTTEIEEKDYTPFEECQPKGEEETLPDAPSDTQPSDDVEEEQTDIYALRNEEYKRKQEKHRLNVIAAIIKYTQYTMSPYVNDDKELEKLCGEIRKWADKYTYSPIPIILKQKLTTLDLRHFVWNIGERLGTKNGYSGHVRADFIKSMFPDIMKDCEIDSIRNFTFKPNKGSIKLDPPDEDDYAFHYDE